MNPKRIKRSVLPLIVVSFLAMISMNGCKNATSANMTGTFGGRVLLFDSTHTALSDCSGVTVQLDGTPLKAATDSLGNWTIGIVPEGAYNITATKSGYGTYRWDAGLRVGR